jgi:hypothetical protein
MSGVNLNTFIDAARRKDEGEVRFAKDSGNRELVNKGTFGNRVSTWIQNIKEWFRGAVDPTRATRQQAAVTRFQEVMRGHFRDDVANRAMTDAGIVAGGPMTGRQILDAVARANAAMDQNVALHAQAQRDFMPGLARYEGIVMQLPEAARPGARALGPAAQLEFQERLAENLKIDSRYGRAVLTPVQVERVALRTLKDVLRVQAGGPAAFGEARAARREAVEASKGLLRTIAGDRDSAAVMGSMVTFIDRRQAAITADRIVGPDAGDMTTVSERSMMQAMRELSAEDPGLVRRAQTSALRPDSPLKAISFEARTYAGNARVFSDRVGYATQTSHLINDIVGVMGRFSGAMSGATIASDVADFGGMNMPEVSDPARAAARAALQPRIDAQDGTPRLPPGAAPPP